ncbi:unnamed protein product [Gongylonema pulchrum]|uniref:Uncharacterized protein n=1 Tax=Gongylonema pulchrum TaxID=637853 RepID=A0A183D6A0_9BILA|nr:unnamed protein product [Gongylonema pulchrum]
MQLLYGYVRVQTSPDYRFLRLSSGLYTVDMKTVLLPFEIFISEQRMIVHCINERAIVHSCFCKSLTNYFANKFNKHEFDGFASFCGYYWWKNELAYLGNVSIDIFANAYLEPVPTMLTLFQTPFDNFGGIDPVLGNLSYSSHMNRQGLATDDLVQLSVPAPSTAFFHSTSTRASSSSTYAAASSSSSDGGDGAEPVPTRSTATYSWIKLINSSTSVSPLSTSYPPTVSPTTTATVSSFVNNLQMGGFSGSAVTPFTTVEQSRTFQSSMSVATSTILRTTAGAATSTSIPTIIQSPTMVLTSGPLHLTALVASATPLTTTTNLPFTESTISLTSAAVITDAPLFTIP